jgi:hypothetical protein
VSVDVHDRDGKTYQAAALRIESGPQWPNKLGYFAVDAVRGGGTLPLLVRYGSDSAGPFIQSPQALHEGHRVRVSGKMVGALIDAPAEDHWPWNQPPVSRQSFPNRAGALIPVGEHVIIMRGKAKLLKETACGRDLK